MPKGNRSMPYLKGYYVLSYDQFIHLQSTMGLALGITGAFYVRRHVQTKFTQLFNIVEATVQQHGRSIKMFGAPIKLHYPSPPQYTTRLSTRVQLNMSGTKQTGSACHSTPMASTSTSRAVQSSTRKQKLKSNT